MCACILILKCAETCVQPPPLASFWYSYLPGFLVWSCEDAVGALVSPLAPTLVDVIRKLLGPCETKHVTVFRQTPLSLSLHR